MLPKPPSCPAESHWGSRTGPAPSGPPEACSPQGCISEGTPGSQPPLPTVTGQLPPPGPGIAMERLSSRRELPSCPTPHSGQNACNSPNGAVLKKTGLQHPVIKKKGENTTPKAPALPPGASRPRRTARPGRTARSSARPTGASQRGTAGEPRGRGASSRRNGWPSQGPLGRL